MRPSYRSMHHAMTPTQKRRKQSFLRNYLAQLTQHKQMMGDDLIVMGGFNGRVGPRRTPWETYLGPHSDANTECNYNGEQLLALCVEHGLWITNTFYNHRQSQRQTWYKWNDLGVERQCQGRHQRQKEVVQSMGQIKAGKRLHQV